MTLNTATRKVDIFGELDMNDNELNGIKELSLTGTDFQVYNDFNSSTGQGGTWIETDNRLFFGKHGVDYFITCQMNMNTQQTVFSGEVSLSNQKITLVGTPEAGTDAANKTYVDNAVAGGGGGGSFLPLAGGTMTGDITLPANVYLNLGTANRIGALSNNDIILSRGAGSNKFVSISDTEMEMRNININMGDNKISGLIGGSAGTDAVNVNQMNTRLSLFGGTMNADINMGSNTLTNLKEPFNQLDAATKKYVDEQVAAAIQGLINNELTQKSDKTLTDLELERLDGLIQSLL